MVRKIAAIVLFAFILTAPACGSSDETSTPANDGGEATSAASGSAEISLPDGWTMTDAISAEEVGAITGESMEAFPEAGSAAQSGRPAGSYIATGKTDAKIFFSVDVQGGEQGYEQVKEFTDPASIQEVSGVGDKAYVCTFSDGRTGIIALKGDAVVRVDWNPSAFAADPAEFGGELAGKLLENLYQ
ncbi:MAG TPA: hypothetical protein VFH61_12990 [Thermoleophilia bacterium]|nr:hypothetical protein [Thermoleophilia bacterium]